MLQIDRVQLVTIPTSDQERSLAFYRSLGFEVRVDAAWDGGHRWIEVYPPGAPTGLAPCRMARTRSASGRASS